MKTLFTLIATLATATAAHAHPGHVDTVAGHSHWELLAGIAILAAAGALVWKAFARK